LTLGACGGGNDGDSSTGAEDTAGNPVKDLGSMVYTTPSGFIESFFVMYVADQEGFWKKQGLNVTVRGGQGTAAAVQAVAGGTADISSVGGMNTLTALDAGADLSVVGQYNQVGLWDMVSRADRPIKSPQELAGKKVGIWSAGGASELVLNVLAGVGGVKESSVERPIVGAGPAGYAFLDKGSIDAWVAEPQTVNKLVADGAKVYRFGIDDFAPIPDQAFITSSKYANEQGPKIEAFLRGVKEAMEFVNDPNNLDQVAKDVLHFNPDLNESDLKEITLPVLIKALKTSSAGYLQLQPQRWDDAIKTMRDAGLIKMDRPASDFLVTKYAEAAGS
jgi:NitT/TauT family transport system substrate-binding protein